MDKEMIMNIALAVIAFIGSIITGVLVPYIKNCKDKNKIIITQMITDMLVKSAENILIGKGRGDEKYKFVYDELVKKFPKLKMDEAKILIESAVEELHNAQKKLNG